MTFSVTTPVLSALTRTLTLKSTTRLHPTSTRSAMVATRVPAAGAYEVDERAASAAQRKSGNERRASVSTIRPPTLSGCSIVLAGVAAQFAVTRAAAGLSARHPGKRAAASRRQYDVAENDPFLIQAFSLLAPTPSTAPSSAGLAPRALFSHFLRPRRRRGLPPPMPGHAPPTARSPSNHPLSLSSTSSGGCAPRVRDLVQRASPAAPPAASAAASLFVRQPPPSAAAAARANTHHHRLTSRILTHA